MALVTHILLANSHTHVTFRLLGLFILFFLSLSLHNKQVLAEDKDLCQFSQYSSESKESLTQAKNKLAPLVGKKFESNDGIQWKYTVGICTTVGDIPGTAVLQTKLDDKGETTDPRVIGTVNNTHISAGSDWIMLEYKGGENYKTHCNKEEKRSVIMITCDLYIDDSQAEMIFMGEENNKQESCYYLFEMKHQAACPAFTGTKSLSVGTILIIVFFSVVGVYLIVGFLYARYVLRSKGVEQIPNYEFWKDFCNLQADGCDFVCRSKGRQRANHFGGLGDDQLEPSDTIQDDHLLPM